MKITENLTRESHHDAAHRGRSAKSALLEAHNSTSDSEVHTMSANKKSLFDVMSDFESIGSELARVSDLLSILDERLTNDVELLDGGWKAENFKRRYQASKSLMDTLHAQLTNSIQSMNEITRAGYIISQSLRDEA